MTLNGLIHVRTALSLCLDNIIDLVNLVADYWLPFCFSNFKYSFIPNLAHCEERLTNIVPCRSGFVFLHSDSEINDTYYLSSTFAPNVNIPTPAAPVHAHMNLGLKRVVGLVAQTHQNSKSSDTVILVWFDKNYKLSLLYFNIFHWNSDAKCWNHYSECIHYFCSPNIWNMIHSPDSRIVFFNFSEICYVLQYSPRVTLGQKQRFRITKLAVHGTCRSLPTHCLYYERKRKITWLIYPESYTTKKYSKFNNLLNVVEGSISRVKAESIDHFQHFPETFPHPDSRRRRFRQNWDYADVGLILTECESKHNKKRPRHVRDDDTLSGFERYILWFDPCEGGKSWFRFPLPLLSKQFRLNDSNLLLGGNGSFVLSSEEWVACFSHR